MVAEKISENQTTMPRSGANSPPPPRRQQLRNAENIPGMSLTKEAGTPMLKVGTLIPPGAGS